MSFFLDQVRCIDGQLDRLQLCFTTSRPPSPTKEDAVVEDAAALDAPAALEEAGLSRTRKLQAIAQSLSTTSSARSLLNSVQIVHQLSQFDQLAPGLQQPLVVGSPADASYDEELQWLIVSKAAAQTYGVILETLLEQTIPLSEDIWYWNEVLASYGSIALYSIQTSPLRLWDWCRAIYADSRRRLALLHDCAPEQISLLAAGEDTNKSRESVSPVWQRFYYTVRRSIQARSLAALPQTVLSPLALSRTEARAKQAGLKKFREMSASGLGVLMNECLRFDVDEDGNILTKGERGDGASDRREEWKSIVEKSITLMETVMKSVTVLDIAVPDFEDTVFASVDDESAIVEQTVVADERHASRQQLLSYRLQKILDAHLPEHVAASRKLVVRYGRPSALVRYWLPAGVLLAFSGTFFRVFFKRKAAIRTWVRELGATVLDFWANWVVEPLRKVIGTIRHDEDSEVALLSKRSLEGDRASLERMVVDFVVDHAAAADGPDRPLSESDITALRRKVKEGDLTPILRAYERDLRRPFVGTLRGDLIRALLIQIQKTKVDVEVAISGIDSLLKSQELVFGFVGLTPGILVTLGVARWIHSAFSNRKGFNRGKRQGQMMRILRNVDRIIASSASSDPASSKVLSYKDHGLLLCQLHELRQYARQTLPGGVFREFLEEIHDLEDIRTGVERQMKVVERIRWAYSSWIQ